MSKLFLGVDGGQSSTTAVVGDEEGRILGRGIGGPCNHVAAAEAEQRFRQALESSVSEACRNAQLTGTEIVFTAACLGLSGGPADKETLTRSIIRAGRYKLTHDAEIALTGAHAGKPGLVVIAGTGSMTFGRNYEGRTARAGGWGYIFGDEGSAFGLVRQGLRRALQAEEGWGASTVLRELLLESTQLASVNEILHMFYTPAWPRRRVAQLAPLISLAAEGGDAVAREVIDHSAAQLAGYVQGLHRHLFGSETAPVAAIGGVFASKLLQDAFTRQVLDQTNCTIVPPQFGPAEGALLEAIQL